MDGDPVLITRGDAQRLQETMRSVAEMRGAGPRFQRRRWPLDVGSGIGGGVGATVELARITAVHEAVVDPNAGPYLEATRQVVTYPGSGTLLYTYTHQASMAAVIADLNAGILHTLLKFKIEGTPPQGAGIDLPVTDVVVVITVDEEWTFEDVTAGVHTIKVLGDNLGIYDDDRSESIAYEDMTGDDAAIVAYPDAYVLRDMQAEATLGDWANYHHVLAEYYAADDRCWAFQLSAGWIVEPWQGTETAIVEIVSTSAIKLVVNILYRIDDTLYEPAASAVDAYFHPQFAESDYTVGERYFAFRMLGRWWVDPVGAGSGYTGTLTDVIDITFDVAGCVSSWETQQRVYVNGLLTDVID